MNRIVLCLAFFMSFILVSQSISGKILHAILVVDTIHPDISFVTQADLIHWQKELRCVAKHAPMTLKEKIFSGSEFQKNLVVSYLQQLTVDEDDVIIFFFSGHGYRTAEKTTPWPFINFEFYKPGIDLHWIAETIRNKKPRLALVMSDCCNNYAEQGFGGPSKNIQINLKLHSAHYPGYAQLFSNAKGCIVIASCSAGQSSYGSRLGGLYTQCFFTSLNRELVEKPPSWKKLLQRANGYIWHIQKPICEIYR